MRSAIGIFIFCIWGLFSPISADAIESSRYGKIIGDGINVRGDATVSSVILGNLKTGNIVKIVGERYSWYKVVLPESFECFVSSEYIKSTGNRRGIVTANSLNVRQAPSLNALKVGRISEGGTVLIEKAGTEWTAISCFPYAYGWVHKGFVKLLSSNRAEAPPLKKEKLIQPEAKVLKKVKVEKKPAQEKVETKVAVPSPNIEVKKSISRKDVRDTEVGGGIHKETKIKRKRKKFFRKKEKKDMGNTRPSSPPIAIGRLEKMKRKDSSCPANYMLKNDTGFILLKIKLKEVNPALFIKKEVAIWGRVKNSSCIFIDVTHIIPSQ